MADIIPINRGKIIKARKNLPYFLKVLLGIKVPSWQDECIEIMRDLWNSNKENNNGNP